MLKYAFVLVVLLISKSCFAQQKNQALIYLNDSTRNLVQIQSLHSIFDTLVVKDSSEIKKYTANDLLGFTIGRKNFIAIHLSENSKEFAKNSFFIEQLVEGKAQLYRYKGIISGYNDLYLYRKKGENKLNAVNKHIKNETPIQIVTTQNNAILGGDAIFNSFNFNNEKPFLKYFENYFSDCELIKNKLKQDFYSPQNLEEIFKEYNNCK